MFSKFFKKDNLKEANKSSHHDDDVMPACDENVEVVEYYDQESQNEYSENKNNSSILDLVVTQNVTATQVVDLGHKAMDIYNNSLMINRSIKELEGKRDVELAKIVAKFEQGKDVLTKVFGERQGALGKHYEVLDKALASNDRELIIESLRGISSMVASRPLQDFNAFLEAWDDKSKPFELDF